MPKVAVEMQLLASSAKSTPVSIRASRYSSPEIAAQIAHVDHIMEPAMASAAESAAIRAALQRPSSKIKGFDLPAR
jgi:hypothetical protein